jgi:hypothetical protein
MRFGPKTTIVISVAALLPSAQAISQTVSAPLQPDTSPTETQSEAVTDKSPPCSRKLWTINDAAPYIGFSEFNGASQIVEQLVYARSQCFKESSLNRWKLDASIAHVGGGGFQAESGSIGIGLELHPFGNTSGFSITPVARVSYDHLHGVSDRIAWGGEITAENVTRLSSVIRPVRVTDKTGTVTKNIAIPGNQLIVAARAAYRRESTLGPQARYVAGNRTKLTGYGMIGWDGYFKGGRTRWQTSVSYQSIDNSAIKGYTSVAISLRKLDDSFQTFKKNYQIITNVGNSGYRSVILSIDFRFN